MVTKGFIDFPLRTPETGKDAVIGYYNGVEYRYPYADLAGSGISQEEADQLYYPRTGDPSGYAGGGVSFFEAGTGVNSLQTSSELGGVNQAEAEGEGALAIMKNSHASGDYSLALGDSAVATGDASYAFGRGARAYGESVVAINRKFGGNGAKMSFDAVWNYTKQDNATDEEIFLANGSNGFDVDIAPLESVYGTLNVTYRAFDLSNTTLKTVKTEQISYHAFKDGGGSYSVHTGSLGSADLLAGAHTFSLSFDTPVGAAGNYKEKVIIPKITTTNFDGPPPDNMDITIHGSILKK